MSHTYVSLDTFKGRGAANVTGGADDARMLALLEGSSRWVENWCRGRHFYPRIETRYFSGNGKKELALPGWDLIFITTLKEDDNNDGIYNVTWATTDYELAPYDHDPIRTLDPKPYWRLEVNTRSAGSQDVFIKGQKTYELVGEFGYCKLVEATGAMINEGAAFGISGTELTVDDGSLVEVGDTLVIESEYLYVTGQLVDDNNTLTVIRGVNGSTPASHADATAVSRLVYPEPIVQAVLMRTGQLWARRTGGYTDQVGFSDSGVAVPQTGMDPDVLQQLDYYKKGPVP